MHKRLASLLCLIIGAFSLWGYGKYAETTEMNGNENEIKSRGLSLCAMESEGTRLEASYEVYTTQ